MVSPTVPVFGPVEHGRRRVPRDDFCLCAIRQHDRHGEVDGRRDGRSRWRLGRGDIVWEIMPQSVGAIPYGVLEDRKPAEKRDTLCPTKCTIAKRVIRPPKPPIPIEVETRLQTTVRGALVAVRIGAKPARE